MVSQFHPTALRWCNWGRRSVFGCDIRNLHKIYLQLTIFLLRSHVCDMATDGKIHSVNNNRLWYQKIHVTYTYAHVYFVWCAQWYSYKYPQGNLDTWPHRQIYSIACNGNTLLSQRHLSWAWTYRFVEILKSRPAIVVHGCYAASCCISREPRIWCICHVIRGGVVCRHICDYFMMTSSNGNIFRVTGPLCGEFTGHRFGVFFDLGLE